MTSSGSSFQLLTKQTAVDDAYVKGLLKKWDLLKGMLVQQYSYSKAYHKMQGHDLVLDLLNDAGPRDHLKVLQKDGSWSKLQGQVTQVQVEVIPATLTRLDMFDRLVEATCPIVRPSGDIIKCMDDVIDGFQVSDMLREMLLNEDSENAGLYNQEERSELLWRVFEHLCLGGPCCQFEDQLEGYLEVAKRLYKELLTVQKSPSGAVEVASVVYRLSSITTSSGQGLFPRQSRNSFCYLAVDPLKRVCKLWYHGFVPFW